MNAPDTTTPLRLLMVVGAYAPEPVGGSERQCALLADALIRRGHTVDVVTFRHTASAPARVEEGAFRVHRLGRRGPSAYRAKRAIESFAVRLPGISSVRAAALGFWLALPAVWYARAEFLRALARFAGDTQGLYDLVHVHESGWLAGACVAQWASRGVRVVCKEATSPALGPIGFDTPGRGSFEAARREAHAWVAQTDTVFTELKAALGDDVPVVVVPNAVNLPEHSTDPAQTGVLYVGNLSQGAQWKGFDVLFDAWVKVLKKRPDARLTVVGGGDAAPWQTYLRQQGADERVTFTGRLDCPEDAYLSAGIFVLPSRTEGMSNALLEAQSFGLACVVSDIPGNRAVVSDGHNGLCVPVGEAQDLADALIRVLDDATLRQHLGQAARVQAESRFGVAPIVDLLTTLYHEQLGRATT